MCYFRRSALGNIFPQGSLPDVISCTDFLPCTPFPPGSLPSNPISGHPLIRQQVVRSNDKLTRANWRTETNSLVSEHEAVLASLI